MPASASGAVLQRGFRTAVAQPPFPNRNSPARRNLINEPRCETWLKPQNADCTARVQSWLEEMAAFVRSVDPNHMITVGSEGFYGPTTPDLLAANPGPWGIEMGQDFVNNTNIPQIDFATVHAWPDNWMIAQVSVPRTSWLVGTSTLGLPVG
jgi:endo-1,4-beta-mannosidase